MSARRCPNCGGLVALDAAWCGQCLARLDDRPAGTSVAQEPPAEGAEEPTAAEPSPAGAGADGSDGDRRRAVAVPAEGRAVRSTPDGVVWDCPRCGEVNDIEARTCPVCGASFATLFEPPPPPPVDPGRAATMSLFFPGLGHIVAGRTAEGVARAIVFAFALATGLLALFAGLRSGASPLFLAVMVLALGAAAALYVLSTLDAGRAAGGAAPIVSTRVLLYGAVGLMLATLTLLTVAAMQAAPGG